MSKNIIFTDKKTLDKLNNRKPIREASKKWNKKTHLLNKKIQTNLLNQVFLENEFDDQKYVKKELEKKRNGYKNQDIKKNLFDDKNFIYPRFR